MTDTSTRCSRFAVGFTEDELAYLLDCVSRTISDDESFVEYDDDGNERRIEADPTLAKLQIELQNAHRGMIKRRTR